MTLATDQLAAQAYNYSLQEHLDGELFVLDGPGYTDALRGWNSAVTGRPALLVRARSSEDVAHAIAFARAHELPLSVRSGGHNTAGLACCDGGVMVDFAHMNNIEIDVERRVARAQPGAKIGGLVAATQAHGLATTTGTCSSVGLGGSTLGGGVGWLMGRYGMTIDNVLQFEVVTADGRVLRASATENTDLFWALRGGGGNFGVVTAIEYQLHPVSLVYGGLVVYPLAQAHEALRTYFDVSANAPDELIVHAALAWPPQAPGPVIVIQACYSGDDLAEGERLVAPLRSCGEPIVNAMQPMPYGELFKMLDAPAPAGLHYYDTAYSLRAPNDEVIAALVAQAASLPGPCGSVIIHPVRGAALRVAPEATAFALREFHFGVVHNAMWLEGTGDAPRAWADASLAAMAPFASEGLQVNFMARGDERAVRATYRANYQRLAVLKHAYDPSNLFCHNQNIVPAPYVN